MYVYIYIYIRTYIHVYIYVYVCVYALTTTVLALPFKETRSLQHSEYFNAPKSIFPINN